MKDTQEENWFQKNKARIMTTIGLVTIKTGGYLLLHKYRKPIEKLFVASLTADNAQLSSRLIKRAFVSSASIVETFSHEETAVEVLASTARQPINHGQPFAVRGGIRNLPNNRRASPQKLELAIAKGFSLGDHHTLVTDYMKNCA